MHDLRKFALRLAALLALNAAAAALLLALHAQTLDYSTWETDARLLTMPGNTHCTTVFLGSSRAHLLGRSKANAEAVEEILGGPVAHLALPAGGGVRPAYYYLREFYARGNSADRIVFESAPWVYFSEWPNNYNKFVYLEPLNLRFLARLVLDGYPIDQVLTYVRSKMTPEWIFQRAAPVGAEQNALSEVPEYAGERMGFLYPHGPDETQLAAYAPYLERILALAASHGTATYLVQFPTLIGKEPGQALYDALLARLAERFDFRHCDFTDAMPAPDWYYDSDHLNSPGVRHFLREQLLPALAQNTPLTQVP